MPYAAENKISQSPIEGGVEITQEQYREALAGMLAGKIVSVENGFELVDPPEPEKPEPETPVEPEEPVYPQLSALEMLALFTPDERRTITEAAMTVVDVKIWYDDLIAASFVTYADPRTERGLQTLVDMGYLTPERKNAIVQQMLPPELREAA